MATLHANMLWAGAYFDDDSAGAGTRERSCHLEFGTTWPMENGQKNGVQLLGVAWIDGAATERRLVGLATLAGRDIRVSLSFGLDAGATGRLYAVTRFSLKGSRPAFSRLQGILILGEATKKRVELRLDPRSGLTAAVASLRLGL